MCQQHEIKNLQRPVNELLFASQPVSTAVWQWMGVALWLIDEELRTFRQDEFG